MKIAKYSEYSCLVKLKKLLNKKLLTNIRLVYIGYNLYIINKHVYYKLKYRKILL